MTRTVTSLAVFGGTPAFAMPVPVGQRNFVGWERFEAAFRGIFSRQYYTNHGPLVRELEERLADFFGVKNVLCMTNATIGLMIAAKALGLHGKVLVPSFTFAATVQSLTWAELEPAFCDVDPIRHVITPSLVESHIDNTVSAILGVHMWGTVCNSEGLARITEEKNLRLYFDAAHSFGSMRKGVPAGRFGDMEIFSFHSDNVLNSLEGGCICTNDDGLAEIVRNIRSSYGIRHAMPVPMTGNGRMSEAQAALALLSLEDYPRNRALNQERFKLYLSRLDDLNGIRLICPEPGDSSNYQHVVAEIDAEAFGLSRDVIVRILEAENIRCSHYPYGGIHRCEPYRSRYPENLEAFPSTDTVCARFMQLPTGQHVTTEDINAICDIIAYVYENAGHIRTRLRRAG